MLYVFRVDTGTMLQMDMNLALATVAELKETIERTCRIPTDKQVLLVSGGQCLDLTQRVCSYSAGTDTNPIYLFSKNSLESRSLSPTQDYGSDGEVTEQVEASLELPSTYSTVVSRVALAQRLAELGRELVRDCEGLVHDQHQQQQGWSAAVANLEDMAVFFHDRSVAFQKDYRAHLDVRDDNLTVLRNFNEDLQILARIPILPPLLASAISLSGLDIETKVTAMTLLEWISAKDNQSSLQQVAEHCQTFLEQLDASMLDSMVRNVELSLEVAGKVDMKEIKGLSERLCGLEQLMLRAKRIVQEQTDLAQSFLQNQYRASNLGDASILPDLCASHKRQLLVMLENQTKLKDIRRRCHKAKEELCENLHHRLRWVAYAQSEMATVGNNLMIYQDSLKRGRRHFMIVRQVQRAPEMYCLAVAEVVRRRTFSRAFLKWAKDLSNRLLATYNEETERRREFALQFGGHFLEALFPGLEDEPPTFATRAPEPFDALLPDLSAEDMETLRQTLPELALRVSWTELSSVAQMFLSKTHIEGKEDGKDGDRVEDRLAAAVSQAGLADKMDATLLGQDDAGKLKEDKDLESETDTDEFEKVSQSPVEKKFDGSILKDSLPDAIRQAGRLAFEVTNSLRAELAELRGQSVADKDSILDLVRQIQLHIAQLTEGYVDQLAALTVRCAEANAEGQATIAQLQQVVTEKESALAASEQQTNSLRVEIEERSKAEKKRVDQITADLNKVLETNRQEHDAKVARLEADKTSLEEALAQLRADKEAEAEKALKMAEAAQAESEARLQQVTENHSRVQAEFSAKEAALNDAIKRYEEQIAELEERLVRTELTAELEMENRLKELETEHALASSQLEARLTQAHQAELQEVTDRLAADYKTELGSLRSRFRLMSITSMEKSPSDSSLEKIERGDVIELANHEAILSQTKEDAELALEKAVADAVLAEQEKSRARVEEAFLQARARMEEEKQVWLQEAVTRALAERDRHMEEKAESERKVLIEKAVADAVMEKDRQLELLIARQQTLSTECQRHRDTIRLLTDGEHLRSGAGTVDPLLERVNNLERERKELLEELTVLRSGRSSGSHVSEGDASQPKPSTSSRHVSEGEFSEVEASSSSAGGSAERSEDMAQSVAVMSLTESVSRDVATSPERSRLARDKMTKSLREVGGKICLTSCAPEDPVLVLWNVEHSNYMVLQESPTLHFLHSDCLDTLGLRPSSDGSPRKLYTTAVVVAKEYCHAKKSENRYRVPKGTKFYRVVVRPLARDRQDASVPRTSPASSS